MDEVDGVGFSRDPQVAKLVQILLGLLFAVVSGFAGVIYGQVRDQVKEHDVQFREHQIQLEMLKGQNNNQDVGVAEVKKDLSGVQREVNKLESTVQTNFQGVNQKLDLLTNQVMENNKGKGNGAR